MSDGEPPTGAEPPRTGGSHRREGDANRLVVLATSLVGVAVAAGLVIFALHERGEPVKSSADRSSKTSTTHPAATITHSTVAHPSPSAVESPSASVTSAQPSPRATAPSSSGAPTTTAAGAASAAPTVAPDGAAPVDVLNDSRITGLAARAASTLRGSGWQVSLVGNFRGTDVPTTTIFYPGGSQPEAAQLAAEFSVQRVIAASPGMSISRVTLVVAQDWPDAG